MMDDRTETHGLPEMMKKNYFLSCWGSDEKEIIPQWALYASKGVRIQLPMKWYIKHQIPTGETGEFMERIPLDDDHPYRDFFFPFPFFDWGIKDRKYIIVPPQNENDGFFVKVVYDENFINLKRQNWSVGENDKIINMKNMFDPIKYKDSYWSFQNEIRFYLMTFCKHEDRMQLPEFID